MRANAHNDDMAVRGGRLHDLVDDAGRARAFEHIDAWGQAAELSFQQRRHGVRCEGKIGPAAEGRVRCRVQHDICAKRGRHRAPLRREICREDRPAPLQPQRQDHRQAHRPAADHHVWPRIAARKVCRVQAHGDWFGQRAKVCWHIAGNGKGPHRIHAA